MDIIDGLLLALCVIGLASLTIWSTALIFYWKRRGIPAAPIIPFVGSYVPLFLKTMALPDFQKYIYDQHPDSKYIGMMDFNTPCVLLKDPELIKKVTVENSKSFPDHKKLVDEDADSLFGRMLFFLAGTRGKEIRSAMSPAFTPSKLKNAFEHMRRITKKMVDYLSEHPEETSSIEMKDLFLRYAGDVVASVAYGISVDSMVDKNNRFFVYGKSATSVGSLGSIINIISYRLSPWFTRLTGASIIPRRFIKFFQALARETLLRRKQFNAPGPDIINYMAIAKEKQKGSIVAPEDIGAQAFNYFFGGFDSLSNLMSFAAYELTVDPEIQNRLRDEVDRVFEEEVGIISMNSLQSMTYLDAVISETLRKHPPIVFTDRVCSTTFELPPPLPGVEGFTLQPNTTVYVPIFGLHHDSKYFSDPARFDPERFTAENKSKILPFSYMPFGAGARNCLGYNYALIATKLILTYLLKHFIFERTERTPVPLIYDTKALNLGVKGGCWVKLVSRNWIDQR